MITRNRCRPTAQPYCFARTDAPATGFTLIELTVVLAIMALLASLIVPAAGAALRKGGVEPVGMELAELARFSSVSAITRHAAATLNIDTARGRCWVSINAVRLPWQEYDREPSAQILASMKIPEGISVRIEGGAPVESELEAMTPAWDTLVFQANGITQDAAIEITNRSGDRYLVEVLGATGAVKTP